MHWNDTFSVLRKLHAMEFEGHRNQRGRQRRRARMMEVAITTVKNTVTAVIEAGGQIAAAKLTKPMPRIVNGVNYIRHFVSPWIRYYLVHSPTYPGTVVRRRFRVPRALFLKIHTDLLSFAPRFWKTKVDGIGREGIRSEVKVLVC